MQPSDSQSSESVSSEEDEISSDSVSDEEESPKPSFLATNFCKRATLGMSGSSMPRLTKSSRPYSCDRRRSDSSREYIKTEASPFGIWCPISCLSRNEILQDWAAHVKIVTFSEWLVMHCTSSRLQPPKQSISRKYIVASAVVSALVRSCPVTSEKAGKATGLSAVMFHFALQTIQFLAQLTSRRPNPKAFSGKNRVLRSAEIAVLCLRDMLSTRHMFEYVVTFNRSIRWLSPKRAEECKQKQRWPATNVMYLSIGPVAASFSSTLTIVVESGRACFNARFVANWRVADPLTREDISLSTLTSFMPNTLIAKRRDCKNVSAVVAGPPSSEETYL